MTECSCKLAGFCSRHGIKKNPHWLKLCQTKPKYFAAWEKGLGPGQDGEPTPNPTREARRARILAAVARTQRIVGWLALFRQPSDRGIGDTAFRLHWLARYRSKDAERELKRLLKQCSCSAVDAAKRLNERFPY